MFSGTLVLAILIHELTLSAQVRQPNIKMVVCFAHFSYVLTILFTNTIQHTTCLSDMGLAAVFHYAHHERCYQSGYLFNSC